MSYLKDLFSSQRSYILEFFDRVDLQRAETVINKIYGCKGTLFFTGVGKSGIIAEKLVMTLLSTGTKAMFLPPTNVLHGDLGIVTKHDLVIMLSKSGETKELIQIIPYLKQKEVETISWVSSANTSLDRLCDFSLELFVRRELCPFDLAPTTSTAIQLIFGDIVAVALMRKKSFSLDDYAKNHPAGGIGQKVLKVRDVMLSGDCLPVCNVQDTLKKALVELSEKKCGCLIVTDDKKQIQGIFTDGDLRRSLQSNSSHVLEDKMEQLMTKAFLSIGPEYLVQDAAKLMQKNCKKWVAMLPVIESSKLVGLIRMHDILQVKL